MANSWLRLWHDMPNDPKWRTISRLSKQPISLVLAVYVHILVDASRNVTRGHVDVTTEDLASALDVTEDQIQSIFDAMQGRVLDKNVVAGWDKRQPKREDLGSSESGAKSAAQRKREQREREKQNQSVTKCHDESQEVTTDKDKDKEYIYIYPISPLGENSQKTKPKKFDPLTANPENVSSEVWAEWIKYRRERKDKITESTCKAQAKKLSGLSRHDAESVIKRSIENGWTGLFTEKVANYENNHRPNKPLVERVNDDLAAFERAGQQSSEPIDITPKFKDEDIPY